VASGWDTPPPLAPLFAVSMNRLVIPMRLFLLSCLCLSRMSHCKTSESGVTCSSKEDPMCDIVSRLTATEEGLEMLQVNSVKKVNKTDAQIEDNRTGINVVDSKTGAYMNEQSQHRRQALDSWLLDNLFTKKPSTAEIDDIFTELKKTLASKGFDSSDAEGNSKTFPQHANRYNTSAKKPLEIKNICERGMNAGYSALRFLSQSQAHVYEFDKGEHSYAHAAADLLRSKFPGKFNVSWGDSTETVPDFHAQHRHIQCDLIIFDGGDSPEVAVADLSSFAAMASRSHILVIDDLHPGPTAAWTQLKEMGCIRENAAVAFSDLQRFRIGRYTHCDQWPWFSKAGEPL